MLLLKHFKVLLPVRTAKNVFFEERLILLDNRLDLGPDSAPTFIEGYICFINVRF